MMAIGRRISLATLGRRALGLVQRGAARGLDVIPVAGETRRGDRIEVIVKVASPDGERPVEVGLVCTETFATFSPQLKAGGSTEAVEDDVAYEDWVAADPLRSEQTVALVVPADVPYSYDGRYLKFRWRVAIRRPRERGIDATLAREIEVRP